MQTKVVVCLFRPTGYELTYIVETDHRGQAALKVMEQLQDAEYRCINSIICSMISDHEGDKLVNDRVARRIKGERWP